MRNTKKLVISLCISLIILGIIHFVYTNFLESKEVDIKVLTKDVYKGEKIPEDIIQNVKIKKSSDMEKYCNIDVSGKVASRNIASGKILETEDVATLDGNEEDVKYEYITIEIKNASDGLAYQLKKGDKVSLYYTVKDKEINQLSPNDTVITKVGNMKTIRLFDDLEVIGLFDTSGNEIKGEGQYSSVMFRVEKENSMVIANIKGEGTFSVALIK